MRQNKVKIGALLLVGVMLCGELVSCGSESEYDSKVTSECKEAISIVDKCLDGELNWQSADEQLDALYDKMDSIDSDDSLSAKTKVNGLAIKVIAYGNDYSLENYNDLVNARNELASLIGASERDKIEQ